MEQSYVWSGQKKLRCGYTTGSCAAAAAKAALMMLLTKEKIQSVMLETPKGIMLTLMLEDMQLSETYAQCGVRKDSGDDPDVTHGLLIKARVDFTSESGITIDGGEGVGRITKPGLEQPVGSAAINAVPRAMIEKEMIELLKEHNCIQGVHVSISVPEGEERAKKTFNPRLGIVGGISILGTGGIVVPMSEQALIDSIRVEMKQKLETKGNMLIIAPGNYGETFSYKEFGIAKENVLLCSNFVGETIDMAVQQKAEKILFIGHIGKFVKLAGGIMNTHSREADSRLEILAANSALCGASIEAVKNIAESNTTDEALDILEENKLKKTVCLKLLQKMIYYLNKRCDEKLEIGIILFSNKHGTLAKTGNVQELLGNGE